ncbi:YdiU family protein [Nitrogeniibacter mangrovi]|uniref:Protein nucleotidyltransferase YdiU n=1 Tax=Nitrogeniibacter mangrovi TaxID=2016596 RepID=A0A6C1B776_9RHOO|nr:YdiU family protein [Nitrogeniibacter mangrovi]QID19213.1 YdiU family protein [Nitrogeniibacter mangrovi]
MDTPTRPGLDRPHRLDALPFDNSFARLPARFYTRLAPWGLPEPQLLAVSDEAAALIGLHADEVRRPEFVEAFAGNQPLPGGETLAAVYSGHQFGVWAGQLGDGRAHLLGEVATADGPWELQLKGGGRTPYSRMGDGRAVLRSSIREFLCSEAMAALGIPTTRALALVGSHEPVQRETLETAAVVTRMSPSFVRFGSFEHWAAATDVDALQTLADYVIDRFYPACREDAHPVRAMLAEVSRRTAALMAQWQAVGFMHGVMNTDNMSILGLTIDYGPFGFMDAFRAGHICNHSDTAGRYRFSHQPHVAIWNLQALGHALMPLIEDPEALKAAIEAPFVDTYNRAFIERMGAKLGLPDARAEDAELITALYEVMQENTVDYTGFFRALATLRREATRPEDDAPVRDRFADRDAADAWLARWRERLAGDTRPDAERQAAMHAVNPKYVLRNWVAESAIRAAQAGDMGEFHAVHACLRRPFDEQPEYERFAAPPPDWADGLEVSCSS